MPETATVTPLAQSVSLQFGFAQWAATKNLEGITDEEGALWPQPAGNSIAWLIGHIIYVRQAFAGAFGKGPFLPAEVTAVYKRGSQPAASPELMKVSELRPLFDQSHAALVDVISSFDEEALAKKAPFSPGGDPAETVGSLVLKLVVHESYHIGQLGILRRLAGKSGAI